LYCTVPRTSKKTGSGKSAGETTVMAAAGVGFLATFGLNCIRSGSMIYIWAIPEPEMSGLFRLCRRYASRNFQKNVLWSAFVDDRFKGYTATVVIFRLCATFEYLDVVLRSKRIDLFGIERSYDFPIFFFFFIRASQYGRFFILFYSFSTCFFCLGFRFYEDDIKNRENFDLE